jgi:hypothetical protein
MRPIEIDLATVMDTPFWAAYELRRLERLLAYEPVCGPAHRRRAVLLRRLGRELGLESYQAGKGGGAQDFERRRENYDRPTSRLLPPAMVMRRVIPRPGIGMVVHAPVVAGTDPDERRWGDCDGWRLGSHDTASRCEGDGYEQQTQQTESVSHG